MARPTCADYAACCRLGARRVAAGFLACLGAGAVGCGLDASGLETARVSFRFSREGFGAHPMVHVASGLAAVLLPERVRLSGDLRMGG